MELQITSRLQGSVPEEKEVVWDGILLDIIPCGGSFPFLNVVITQAPCHPQNSKYFLELAAPFGDIKDICMRPKKVAASLSRQYCL